MSKENTRPGEIEVYVQRKHKTRGDRSICLKKTQDQRRWKYMSKENTRPEEMEVYV